MRGGAKVKKHGPNAGMDQVRSQIHPTITVRHDKNPERGFTKGHGPKGHGQGHRGRRSR